MGVANRGALTYPTAVECFCPKELVKAKRVFNATPHVFVPTEYNFRLPNFLWIVCEGQTRYLALFVNAL